MTTKVLVADDCDCISLSVKQILEKDTIFHTNEAKYCDEALLKIKKAINDNVPYNLLITDLNFRTDYRNSKLKSGEELLSVIKKIQPDIKIIVFSEEVKSFRIKSLFKDFNINAFVYKGRNSLSELNTALQTVLSEKYVTPSLEFDTSIYKPLVDISEYDLSLLKLASYGYSLEQISQNLKKLGISPHSKSSIEKGLNKLKIQFNANNKVHLIAVTKDIGII